MRGRKPNPTAIKILRGVHHSKLNQHEAEIAPSIPDCPDHLDQEAQDEWARMATELLEAGLLTKVDRAAFAGYCVAWSTWVEASNVLAKTGKILRATSGTFYRNPWLDVANRALKQMREFLVEFGMTPSSRSRVTATKKQNTGIAKRHRA